MEQWSPDQISHHAAISHETIYQRVYADKRAGGLLWQQLRLPETAAKTLWQGRPARHHPQSPVHRAAPGYCRRRSRIGDWEADTVIGMNHKQAIVSLVERKSGYYLIRKKGRTQDSTGGQRCHDPSARNHITVGCIPSPLIMDENLQATSRSAKLKADFYFAHPYASWERGL